jgi:glucose/arabinose dehydrogenase
MRVGRSVVFACVMALGLGTIPTSAAMPSPETTDIRTVAAQLVVPWGIGFLPDGTAMVTERDTFRVLRLANGTASVLWTIEDAAPTGSTGGLLGLAVSPKYAEDKTVFVYYSTLSDNRIARLVNGRKPEAVVTGIPKGTAHNGGRLAFGPDGYLYATTGDAMVGSRAQDLNSLAGKILRITGRGKGAPGNPFPQAPLVYTYGHRDPEGITWDQQGRMYSAELGDERWDEVNRIEAGKNYGWPACEGQCSVPNTKFVDPLVKWPTSQASPSGVSYYRGSLYVAALQGQGLWKIRVRADGSLDEPQSLQRKRYGRLRTVIAAPDGRLWFTTTNRDQHGTPGVGDDRILSMTH